VIRRAEPSPCLPHDAISFQTGKAQMPQKRLLSSTCDFG
jgi:hypothetical protein